MIDQLITNIRSRTLKKGEFFLAEGQVCRHAGFLIKGLMLVIEQVFIATLQALGSLYTDTREYRYEKFIKNHPDLQQRIS